MPVPLPKTRIVPVPRGDGGTLKTVEYMARMIRQGSKLPQTRSMAVSVALHYPNDIQKVDAVFRFVKSRMTYMRDNVFCEALSSTEYHLRQFEEAGQAAGDCDDHVVLLGSLLASIGYPVRIVIIRARPGPGPFDHVYLETLVRGQWIPMDATKKSSPMGWAFPKPSRIRKFGV